MQDFASEWLARRFHVNQTFVSLPAVELSPLFVRASLETRFKVTTHDNDSESECKLADGEANTFRVFTAATISPGQRRGCSRKIRTSKILQISEESVFRSATVCSLLSLLEWASIRLNQTTVEFRCYINTRL